MSIRRDGPHFAVICDGCDTRHRTSETVPVLAFYDATLRHGWTPGSGLRPGLAGVYCPPCATRQAQKASDERNLA